MTRLIRGCDKLFVAQAAWILGLARKLRRRPADHPPRDWVVMKLVGMGDAVLMLPVLEAIRRDPANRLTVITSHRCAGIFRAPGVADEVITPRRWVGVLRALRGADVVLDFEQHVYWSAALAALASRRATTYGFETRSRRRRIVYDHRVSPGPGIRHMKEIFDDMGRAAGLEPRPGLVPLPVDGEAAAAAEAWRGCTVFAPGSGATVPSRRMSAAQWAGVVDGLPPEECALLVGTRLEADLLSAIQGLCRRRVEIKTDFNLQGLAAAMAVARRVFATDSGPMHLAAAMGTPVVGIFGPDSPLRYRPYNERSAAVSLAPPCSPCNNCWVYREARCTNPDRFACIRELTPERVLADAGDPVPGLARGAAAGQGAHDHGEDDRA